MHESYYSAHSSTGTPPTANKTILTASFTEMTSGLSGALRVTKNKSQKSAHITEFSTGLSSDSSELSIPAALEEVISF